MIDERMSYRQKDKNGLGANISGRIRPKNTKKFKKKVSFGGCNLGGIRGKLSRKEIYEDFSGFSINEV